MLPASRESATDPAGGRVLQLMKGRSVRMQETAPGAAVTASVKWYDPVKGFGFLAPVDGSRDVFCHSSAVARAGWLTLPEGASVTCEVAYGRRGPVVSSIIAVDTSTVLSAPAGRGRRRHGAPQYGRRDDGDDAAVEELLGTVKFYDAGRDFGFVVPDGGGPDVFLHAKVLNRAGLAYPEPGQQVRVMVARGVRGPQATDIELL